MDAISQMNDLASRLKAEPNPALLENARKRAESVQNRIADKITDFAGSMTFVYLHILWFGTWIGFRVEHYPFGLLTMIVSLEAIFLATFVMISQNRQAARDAVRNQLDFENNIRSEIWSVHVGHALGLDVDHVEQVVQLAIEGAERALKEAQSAPG